MTSTSLSMRGNDPPILYKEGDGPWLVFWREELEPGMTGWAELHPHSCDGFRCNELYGYVIALPPKTQSDIKLLSDIAEESFCADCDEKDLDYGVNPEHLVAYAKWLAERELEAGDSQLLQQAVYPLMASVQVMQKLGFEDVKIPEGAHLLVLGWNCD